MTITFYLNNDRKQNLYCRISDGNEREVFSLGYKVEEGHWDKAKGCLNWDDSHYFTLIHLKQYLMELAEEMRAEGKTGIPNRIKNTLTEIVRVDGIMGVDKLLFNKTRSEGVPEFDLFVKAFCQYRNLNDVDFVTEVVDDQVIFHVDDCSYVANTYAGLKAELTHLVEKRSYDELVITDLSAWNAVLMDGGEVICSSGIEKGPLYRELFLQWMRYWDDKYQEVRETVGTTSHLDMMKEDSWRALQVFMDGYSSSTTPVFDAEELDWGLCPCLILAMLEIYDRESCFDEYCEFHFESWDSEEVDGEFFYFSEEI